MKKHLLISTVAAAILMFGSLAQAGIINLTPADAGWTSSDNSNLTIAEVMAILGYADPLEEYYKADVGETDVGDFASSYETVFSNTALDPQDFLIEYGGGPSIDCPDCFLLVKDGKHDPAQYFFDISDWDGMMDISGTGFWPAGGAISHVTIFGFETDDDDDDGGGGGEEIPEPGIMALFGIGLLGMGLSHRRRRKAS